MGSGPGKSILTSSVIQYLRDQYASKSSLSTTLAYFYFSFSDPQKSKIDMLVMSASSFSNVHVVIDALDECPLLSYQRENLLKSLGRILINEPKNLHIFLTSRKEQNINKKLRAFLFPLQQLKIDLLAQYETLNHNIHHYIDLKLTTDDFDS
ncbi:hypothetical protein V8C34DRAFT_318913 [Trichoderma compactum]